MKSIVEFLVTNHINKTDNLYLGPKSDFSNQDELDGKFIKLFNPDGFGHTEDIIKIRDYNPNDSLYGYYTISNIQGETFNIVINNGWKNCDPILDTSFKICTITNEEKDVLQVADKVYNKIIADMHIDTEKIIYRFSVSMNGTYKKL